MNQTFSPLNKHKLPFKKSIGNYEQVVQKQLNDDFQVYEYLEQNKLEGNVEEYMKLYNGLLVSRGQKEKNIHSLNVIYNNLVNAKQKHILQLQMSPEQLQHNKNRLDSLYEQTQIKTLNQIQVKQNLCREIIQSKKSLSLLKGDIGHLIDRDQCAKLLSSKISKVKIVADDQLKRVNLAFCRDKQQLKIRSNMQNRFQHKLKNVSLFEQASLNRMKRGFIEIMQRKKDLYEKLTQLQRSMEGIQQSGNYQKQKNLKNYQSLHLYHQLQGMVNIIEQNPLEFFTMKQKYSAKMIITDILKNKQIGFIESQQINRQQQQLFYQKIQELKEKFSRIYQPIPLFSQKHCYSSDDVSQITRENLNNIIDTILAQYNDLQSKADQSMNIYNQQMSAIQQLWRIYQKTINQQKQLSYKLLKQYQNSFTIQPMDQYYIIMKKLKNNLNVIFNILIFLHKKYQYNKYSIGQQASKLHKIFLFLFRNGINSYCEEEEYQLNEIEQINKNMYEDLIVNLKYWLNDCIYHNNHSPLRKKSKINTDYLINQKTINIKQNNKMTTQQQQLEKILQNQYQQIICEEKQNKNHRQLRQTVSLGEIKAKRIQFLQTIDQDYYKMLKNTLIMQKQNTRKNYQFMSSFKRAKYANRDQILQEKRYQSSFSFIFNSKQSQNHQKLIKSNRCKTTSKLSSHQSHFSNLKLSKGSSFSIKKFQNNKSKMQKVKLSNKLKNILYQTKLK